MPEGKPFTDVRFIEAGFPCHQVGAETRRERGASSALPPLYFLHVWWARRPLTPSRAAIMASLLPAETDPDWFLRELGIEKIQAMVNGAPWTLTGRLPNRIKTAADGREYIVVDKVVQRALNREQDRRAKNRKIIDRLLAADSSLRNDPVIVRWIQDSQPLSTPLPEVGEHIDLRRIAADPAHVNERIQFRKSDRIQKLTKGAFSWDPEDMYGYGRAYTHHASPASQPLTILDPTAGGGSIPFEALRLGHHVVANDLNPVAAVILHATLDYPVRFGHGLIPQIEKWGQRLIGGMEKEMAAVFPMSAALPNGERRLLENHLKKAPHLVSEYDVEYVVDYLYCRQVVCPRCGGEAPLLNTCWLSKTEGDEWAIRIIPDGRKRNGKVRFETYRVRGACGQGRNDPNYATVKDAEGTCVHCEQPIPADEIKRQARGESSLGTWVDRLYSIVAVRFQPQLDKSGQPQHYKTGKRAGEIKTKKVRFFRLPNEQDSEAIDTAKKMLHKRWSDWEEQGLIPTETIPPGYNTAQPLRFGMRRWCEMFTPRQLLGHLFLCENLNRFKPQILGDLGEMRGRAVVTYLHFVIDKGLDYNSKQTRWENTRGIVKGTFSSHDFAPKWTFGEMVFSGPNSGARWAYSQVLDAYKGIAELIQPIHKSSPSGNVPVTIWCGTAANLQVPERSVDLICIDPPYYNNVQYAELSDFFYVWQKRTLGNLYPDLFQRRLTTKINEAVANPTRAGSKAAGDSEYHRLMSEIFAECRKLVKGDGLMTIMFTHKTQDAWTALTQSLIKNGWSITSSFPVDSEGYASLKIMNKAAATSSIFITCRKRIDKGDKVTTWTGFGETGVVHRVRKAVRRALQEFEPLKLSPVDEMVASYGRALQVLSQNWPVLDGDEPVSPTRAMLEASAVVAQHQIKRLTGGRLRVGDLNPEAAMALTLYGIFGLSEFPYDEARNLSLSLNLVLDLRPGGYTVAGRMIGVNTIARTRGRGEEEDAGYYAPLLRRASKLRLALPEERNQNRIEKPQTEWDILHGVIRGYREGDVPVARGYLLRHAAGREQLILDLLSVWALEMADESLRKEAEAILFGLQS